MFSTGSPLLARCLLLRRLGGGRGRGGGPTTSFAVVSVALQGSAVGTTTPVYVANNSLLTSSSSASSSSSSAWRRWYITRAHPQPTPVVAVPQALEETLEDAQRRRRLRQRKWKRNEAKKKVSSSSSSAAAAAAAAVASTTTATLQVPEVATIGCSHPDETIDLAVNLNLDPRKPGQSLRGNISLPHGTGKKLSCLVFTKDADARKKARSMGALFAGGESLVRAILGTAAGSIDSKNAPGSVGNIDAVDDDDDDNADVTVSIDSLDRVLATQDMIPVLSKTLARLLGPRGLMPNAKSGTVFPTSESLLESLETQIAGKEVVYRTERAGVVHVPVGKASFGVEKLLENIGSVMTELYKVKPEQYGKTSNTKKTASASVKAKASKHAKYLLSAYLSATQGKSYKLDVRTIDPNSSFFLRAVEAPGAAARAVAAAAAAVGTTTMSTAATTTTTIAATAPPPQVKESSSNTAAVGAEQAKM
jgi:large subunit ribosomal protein L1